ncbi:MAG: peptidase M48, partial [Verrucomicrobia bacterium]
MPPFAAVALVLILARATAELWLSRLNQGRARARANDVPPAFRAMIAEPTYRRSVDYTLAKSRFGNVASVFDAVVLIAVLFSGVLPWSFGRFSASFGTSALAMAGFLFVTGI